MKYLVERVKQSCYDTLKDRENTALLDLSQQCSDIGLNPKQLILMISAIQSAEEGFAITMDNLAKMSEIGIESEKAIHPILTKSYEDHRLIRINDNPNYDEVTRILSDRGDGVSCVIGYNGIFDPRIPELWEKHDVQSGDAVNLYHHNMNGIDYSVRGLIKPIGYTIEGANPEYEIEVHKVRNKNGLHLRPLGLITQKAITHKDETGLGIIVEDDEKEVPADSIMGMMTMGIKQGERIAFKYEKPTNPEQAKIVKEVRAYIEQVLSGELDNDAADNFARSKILNR